MKVVIPQAVLIIILKGSTKKQILLLDIIKFIDKSFVDCFALSHVLERFQKNLIKIPVDQIVFVLKVSVKGLPCCTAYFNNFFYCDFFYRRIFHTFFHRFRKPVFHTFRIPGRFFGIL